MHSLVVWGVWFSHFPTKIYNRDFMDFCELVIITPLGAHALHTCSCAPCVLCCVSLRSSRLFAHTNMEHIVGYFVVANECYLDDAGLVNGCKVLSAVKPDGQRLWEVHWFHKGSEAHICIRIEVACLPNTKHYI